MWLVENGDGYHGRIKGTSEQTLRENILAIVDSIEDCKARTTVLSIINYLIQLYKTASDAGSPNAFGTAIGVGGLITGVVADIMGGMNSGLSQNAIIADVIVDVALWGVAEYGDDVGQVVGAMVGSGGDPAGTAIGKIVGSAVVGVVGNGVSIAMNVDLDGDGKTIWYESTIQRVLHRVTYMGEIEHFQSVTEDPLTHERKKVDREKHVRYDLRAKIPRIIEPNVWNAAQKAIESRSNPYWTNEAQHSINGMVTNKNIYCRKMRCGCGRRFKFDPEKKDYGQRGTFRCYELVEDGSQTVREECNIER